MVLAKQTNHNGIKTILLIQTIFHNQSKIHLVHRINLIINNTRHPTIFNLSLWRQETTEVSIRVSKDKIHSIFLKMVDLISSNKINLINSNQLNHSKILKLDLIHLNLFNKILSNLSTHSRAKINLEHSKDKDLKTLTNFRVSNQLINSNNLNQWICQTEMWMIKKHKKRKKVITLSHLFQRKDGKKELKKSKLNKKKQMKKMKKTLMLKEN